MRKKLLFFVLLLVLCLPVYAQAASKYPYMVTVNATKNIVTVYEQDKAGKYTVPKKAFICSTGKYTPAGTFRTSDKYTWRLLFGDVYGQYATRIHGHILFHSVPYFEQDKSTLEYEEYNKLGTQASAGCIRLTVEDAKWIYDNCPAGTTVKIYGDKQEPLKPKQPKKIDTTDTLRRGWDPTDPAEENPWKKGDFRGLLLKEKDDKETQKEIKAFYQKGIYFLSAADAKQLLANFGLNLNVPTTEAQLTKDTVTVWNREKEYKLHYYVENGTIYYKLRDLTEAAGMSVAWDAAKMRILVGNGTDTVYLYETV